MEAQKFSCYLFKERYQEFEGVVDDLAMTQEGYHQLELVDDIHNGVVKGYLRRDKPTTPVWASKLRRLFVLDDLRNKSNSLIFFVKTENRIFCFTYGYSHAVVDTRKIEWDFGVKVALNEMEPGNIRGVDARKLSLSSHQKREIASSNSRIFDFEFDFDEEFINSITGKSSSENIASSFVGKESLKVNVELDLTGIEDYCKNLLESYNKTDYKRHFPFYDKLKLVKDQDVYEEFISQLRISLNDRDNSKIVIAYPNIDDFDFFNYRLIYDRKRQDYPDIGIEILFDFIEAKNLNVDTVNFEKFHVTLMHDDREKIKQNSILEYIVYEFIYNNEKYIHSNSMIFNINENFYQKLIDDIKACETNSIDTISFPPIEYRLKKRNGKTLQCVEDEGSYNERVEASDPTHIYCLDKNNFRHFPDRPNDQIEICDLATSNKELVCVKIYKNSSSTLSHLFQQGYVSAEMLVAVKEYREKLLDSVRARFGSHYIDAENLNRTEIKYIYAIGMKNDGSIADNLPFFSKISLRQNIKDLKRLNFTIQIIKVNFQLQVSKN